MTLSEKQAHFTQLLARLLTWAATQPGLSVVLGEVARTLEQQRLYVQQGKSQTMQSKHLQRLAADVLVFQDGVYQTGSAAYRPLGEHWKMLDSANKWGGDWGWDANHFEYAG